MLIQSHLASRTSLSSLKCLKDSSLILIIYQSIYSTSEPLLINAEVDPTHLKTQTLEVHKFN